MSNTYKLAQLQRTAWALRNNTICGSRMKPGWNTRTLKGIMRITSGYRNEYW